MKTIKTFKDLEKGDNVYLINLKSPFENPKELVVKSIIIRGDKVEITVEKNFYRSIYARDNYNFCLEDDYSLFYVDEDNPIVVVVQNSFEYGDSRRLSLLQAALKDFDEKYLL